MSLPNINEQTVLISVTGTSQNITLPFWPENVLFVNSGTASAYVRAANNGTDSMTVPVAGAFGSWSEIPAGHVVNLTWSSTNTFKNLIVIGAGATTLTANSTRIGNPINGNICKDDV